MTKPSPAFYPHKKGGVWVYSHNSDFYVMYEYHSIYADNSFLYLRQNIISFAEA